MKKITAIRFLVALLMSGLMGGCAAKPTPVPPDVLARNLAGSGATDSQVSESGVGGDNMGGSAGRFSDIEIQESDAFGPGVSSDRRSRWS